MAMTHSDDLVRPATPQITGPVAALGAACLGTLAVMAVATRTLPTEAVLPAVATALFVLSAAVAWIAWENNSEQQQAHRVPSYWDVAGLLTFGGICVAALIEPDAMAQLIETSNKPR